MKPEPLTKEKALVYLGDRYYHEEFVKSAVQLVLYEIQKKKDNILAYALLDNSENKRYSQFIEETLTWFEDLVKKAFSGVIEK